MAKFKASSFSVLSQIRQGSRILYYTGIIHLVLVFSFLILLGFDSREVNNESVWLKPLRFAISIWLFTWTYSWFSGFIEKGKKIFRFLNYVIAICMLMEISLITFQSARGVGSHFNVQTGFDATIFSFMGAFIGLNAIILGIWFLLFVFYQKGGEAYRSSIIWGMALFLLGNLSGYLLIRYGWPTDISVHSSKMPVTGWRLTMKDLKISHALGLHAIQVLPLARWFLKKFNLNATLIHVVGFLYLTIYVVSLLYFFN